MNGGQLAAYLGGALAYALASGAVLVLAGWAARRAGLRGRWLTPAALPALGLALVFVFLAFSPFPDRATLDCSRGGMAPELTPFGFLQTYQRLWDRGAGPGAWLRNMTVTSSAMNFLLCAAIGVALRGGGTGPVQRWSGALLCAVGLSGMIELSQLTGMWGIYPCAYRRFDVDDLILNVAGIAVGFALAGLWRARPLRP